MPNYDRNYLLEIFCVPHRSMDTLWTLFNVVVYLFFRLKCEMLSPTTVTVHCCIWNVPPLSSLWNLMLLLISVASLALLPLHSFLLPAIMLLWLTPTLLFVLKLRRRHHFFGPLVKASWNLLLLLKWWGVNPGLITCFHAARQESRRAKRVGSKRKTNPGI